MNGQICGECNRFRVYCRGPKHIMEDLPGCLFWHPRGTIHVVEESEETARCSLEWCNAWREGDICSWGWDMSKDEPFECRHPRGRINVVDEKEVCGINEEAEV